jgi:4-hydroxybenzoate polyprenyltransferase
VAKGSAAFGEVVLLTAVNPTDTPEPQLPAEADRVPIVVDLDDTLLRTDSFIESIFVLARTKPMYLFRLPAWRLKGTAHCKRLLAAVAIPDVHLLPYHPGVLTFLREQKALGRPMVLAAAADEGLAREINRDIGLFDEILASDGRINLSGKRKRDRLIVRFGERGFDYLGSRSGDFPVWCAARRALLVSPSPHLEHKVASVTPIERVFREQKTGWLDYLHALRVHHWVKNLLVFMPLALAHRFFEFELLGRAALAFVAFNLCASGVYLLNDLLDLPADRRHPKKKGRRLASGRIRLAHALVMMPLILAAAFGIAWHLSTGLAAILAAYVLLMVEYSMKLKDIAIVDVLVLASGYALRVAAGAVAVSVGFSPWLLTFCVFLFLSLALIKRCSELVLVELAPGPSHARGYSGSDKVVLVAQGIASGYLSVLVLALYTNSDISQRMNTRHDFFWGVCLLLLYWVSYLWMMAMRGQIHNDPVIFALSDRVSRWTMAITALVTLIAI